MKSAAGKILIVFVALWIGALVFFMRHAASFDCDRKIFCDNVAVLTGGRSRVFHALRSAEKCNPKNIFISGVHAKTTLKDILPEGEMKNVRIILGKKAKNTRENALEINEWSEKNNISEILLITSDYHMPRSISELKRVNGRLKILPYPVKSEPNLKFMWHCIKEFHKIILACVRI
ncbi:MAG: YdcF family protein [Holosporaceae bacterium]|jgi:uncharacterized SAM-binding protein YcdF (DUF218 family)|nr:YdcF family protein [Holosporaceae bacterium]